MSHILRQKETTAGTSRKINYIYKETERIMKWNKFTLTTTTQAVDLVSAMFDEIGIEGIEIEDHVPLTEAETKGK